MAGDILVACVGCGAVRVADSLPFGFAEKPGETLEELPAGGETEEAADCPACRESRAVRVLIGPLHVPRPAGAVNATFTETAKLLLDQFTKLETNAKLTAELSAACQGLLQVIEEYQTGKDEQSPFRRIQAAKDAIEKATVRA